MTLCSNSSTIENLGRCALQSTSENVNFKFNSIDVEGQEGDIVNDDPSSSLQTPYALAVPDIFTPKIRTKTLGSHLYRAIEKDEKGNRITRLRRIPGAITAGEHPRYRAYRARQRKDLGKDGKPVWPDELEDAFQQAIRDIPPILGKKKIHLRRQDGTTKPSGRNEIIAHRIRMLTGVDRERKQISSHIQVIKNFLAEDSEMAKFISTDASKVDATSSKSIRFDESSGRLLISEPSSSSRTHGAKLDCQKLDDTRQLPDALKFRSSTSALKPLIQEIEFSMYIYSPSAERDSRYEPNHMCTTVQSQVGAQSKVLDEVEDWSAFYPELPELFDGNISSGCDLILLEASIALMDASPPSGSAVSIHYDIDINCPPNYQNWQLCSTFYEDVGKQEKKIPRKDLSEKRVNESRTRLMDVSLDSSWWVRLFDKALAQRRVVEEAEKKKLLDAGHPDCACKICQPLREAAKRAIEEEDRNCHRYFREMSTIQEISASDSNGGNRVSKPKRVAVLLWRFRRTRPGEVATTTWRRLKRPELSCQNSLAHPLCQQTSSSLEPEAMTICESALPCSSASTDNSLVNTIHHSHSWESLWPRLSQELMSKIPSSQLVLPFDCHNNQSITYPESQQTVLTPTSSTFSSFSQASTCSSKGTSYSLQPAAIRCQDQHQGAEASENSNDGIEGCSGQTKSYYSDLPLAKGRNFHNYAYGEYSNQPLEHTSRSSTSYSHLAHSQIGGMSYSNAADPNPSFGQNQFRFPPSYPPAVHQHSVLPSQPETSDVRSQSSRAGYGFLSGIHAPQPKHHVYPPRVVTPQVSSERGSGFTINSSEFCESDTTQCRQSGSAVCGEGELLDQLATAGTELESLTQEKEVGNCEELCWDTHQLDVRSHIQSHERIRSGCHSLTKTQDLALEDLEQSGWAVPGMDGLPECFFNDVANSFGDVGVGILGCRDDLGAQAKRIDGKDELGFRIVRGYG